MSKPKVIAAVCLGWAVLAVGDDVPTGREILEKVDQNMAADTRIATTKMVIHGRRGSRTVVSKSWVQGDKKAYTEYLSPAREAGTKMLKLKDSLWMYSPSTDRTIRISGHMLRQSVMGSDLSYEDMMEDKILAEIYAAKITGAEIIDEIDCWIVELTAEEDVAYQKRKVWVDKERYVPIRQELFAKSGKLLKKMDLTDFKKSDGRWYPTRMIFKDVLKTGSGTEFINESVQFDAEIPEHLFSKAGLRR